LDEAQDSRRKQARGDTVIRTSKHGTLAPHSSRLRTSTNQLRRILYIPPVPILRNWAFHPPLHFSLGELLRTWTPLDYLVARVLLAAIPLDPVSNRGKRAL
jgi:hypothetical protein